jgi:small subunit ribosomal protein S11
MFYGSIKATPNNIFVSIRNYKQNVILTVSSGQLVPTLKGKKKVSSVAVTLLGKKVAKSLKLKKCYLLTLKLYGNLKQHRFIITELWKFGIKIKQLINANSLPHNGCRLKKLPRK